MGISSIFGIFYNIFREYAFLIGSKMPKYVLKDLTFVPQNIGAPIIRNLYTYTQYIQNLKGGGL